MNKWLFLFVFSGLFNSGCVVAEQPIVVQSPVVSTKDAVYPSGTTFFKTDDGKNVPIAVGSTIVIKLNEDTKGKYVWGILENNKSIFEVVTNVSALENSQGGKGVQTRTFTMKATKPGKSNLKLVYFPAGLSDIAGSTYTDTFKLNVNIIAQ